MKKRFLGLILITVCALMLGVSALIAGCDNEPSGEKADYSVIVLAPDEAPLSGITVSWITGSSTAGSATTDAEGKATASLTLGTYTIALAGYGEGLDYDSASVSSSMRSIELQLSVMKVNYTVNVKDKAGEPAANVSVSWTKDGKIAGTANTGADGKAACKLDYGEYSVTLSNIPEGNIYDGAKTVSGKNPAADFELRGGETKTYTVKVRSEGGLIFKELSLFVDKGTTQITTGWTDENGEFTFTAEPDDYTVTPASITDGYSYDPLELTAEVTEGELVLYSEVITKQPLAGHNYVMGDIIHNYSFTTPYEINGKVWSSSVAEILQQKEVLLINNWGTQCSWCMSEMDDMQALYEKYADKIELVAVNNYVSAGKMDTDADISNFYASKNYTFPMMRDLNGFTEKFGISGWPTTIVIDRYGAIARIEAGAITSFEAWERMLLKYIGDDYVQTFIPGEHVSESINTEVAKPDIVLEADHYEKIAEAMNGTGVDIEWYGETEYEYAWPFVLGTDEDVSPDKAVMYSSNTGKANSMSIIYGKVNIEAGKVLTFDYYADTEANDVLSILWDGKIIKQIAGNSNGWQTCYLYTELISGNHNLSMAYNKDSQRNTGKDNVYLRDMRYCEISDITESTDMLRSAAYGTPAAGASEFPYYVKTELKTDDGYYHVKLDSLENKQFAGNDESPLLLVNMLNATNWLNELSLYQLVYGINANTNEYLIDCTFTIDGVTRDYRGDFLEYFKAASASDVPDYVPVDSNLHDLIVALMQKFSQMSKETYYENEWLEVCYFYSHYGSGSPVGDPVLGLMKRSAIPVTEGTYTADLTRNMQPFPTMKYTFTPTENALYKIESLIPDEDAGTYAAQIWLYDDETDPDHALVYSGETRMTRGGVNEQNFEVYRYMQAGHKYYIEVAFMMMEAGKLDFKISNAGQSATVLTQCSEDVYDMVLNELGEFTGAITLAGAVDVIYVEEECEEGEDGEEGEKVGYYHSVNADGSIGDYIYLDVLNADTSALGTVPLKRLIDLYVTDPDDLVTKLDYKMFDFSYCIMYYLTVDKDGNEITNYDPNVKIASDEHPEYTDYTDILRKYIEEAPTEGEDKGLIKVDKTLVKILSLFFELRLNPIYAEVKDGVNVYEIDPALENEWLRFCWYNRTYNENNP